MNISVSHTVIETALSKAVGKENIFFADKQRGKLQPYLEESRHRKIGKAFAAVFPKNLSQLKAVVDICYRYQLPMVSQGGNTGRCFGAQTDDEQAIIINLKNMNRIIAIDKQNMTVTVEAGVVLQQLQEAVAAEGLFFPLSLGAEGSCQIGGNLAANAGGINVLRYGNARDLTLGIQAVMADGQTLNALTGLRKNNTGYDLKNLLIGSEGSLGIISAATLKLFPPEKHTEHGFIALNHIDDAVSCLRQLQQQFAGKISTFELLPNAAIQLMEKHSALKCPIANHHPWYVWYKIADNQMNHSLCEQHIQFLDGLMTAGWVVDATVSQNEKMKQLFAQIRETIVEVQRFAGVAVKLDISVPVSGIAELIDRGNQAIRRICPAIRPYPFGHVGDGNIHYNLMRPENMSDADFLNQYLEPLEIAVLEIVEDLGGSFSAEHGIGSLKVGHMQRYQDAVALSAMQAIKRALDPLNLMNPGKVIPR